jgi:hypothetical protein
MLVRGQASFVRLDLQNEKLATTSIPVKQGSIHHCPQAQNTAAVNTKTK